LFPVRIALYEPCAFSKLNPREFIRGFDLLAICCIHGDADKRSRPKDFIAFSAERQVMPVSTML
jgi:hypothetical protein